MDVSIQDLRKKAPFEKIRLALLPHFKAAVSQAKRSLAKTDDDDDDDDMEIFSDDEESTDDDDDDQFPTTNVHIVKDFKFGFDEFSFLSEKLGYHMDNMLVKLDLYDGFLSLRTVPGDLHGVATGIFSELMIVWARDPAVAGIAGNPLTCAADSSMFLLVFR